MTHQEVLGCAGEVRRDVSIRDSGHRELRARKVNASGLPSIPLLLAAHPNLLRYHPRKVSARREIRWGLRVNGKYYAHYLTHVFLFEMVNATLNIPQHHPSHPRTTPSLYRPGRS